MLEAVVIVGQRQDTGAQGDAEAGQVVRIAPAVEAFMVAADQGRRALELVQGHEGGFACCRMLHDHGPFFAAEAGERLGEQVVGQADLADVVQQGCEHDVLEFCLGHFKLAGDRPAEIGHPPRVAGHAAGPEFQQVGKDLDRDDEVLLQLVVGPLQGGHGPAQVLGALLHLGFEGGVELPEGFVLLGGERFQPPLFQFQRLALQGVAHQQQDVGIVPGLGDVAVDLALVDGVDGGGHVGITGEQQTHRVGRAGPDGLQEMGAVHLGHAHVRDHQIHRFPGQQRQALGAAAGGEDAIALGTEQPAQGVQDVGFVVDEKNRGRLGCGSSPGWHGIGTRQNVGHGWIPAGSARFRQQWTLAGFGSAPARGRLDRSNPFNFYRSWTVIAYF